MRLFALGADAMKTVGGLGLTVGDTTGAMPLWGTDIFLVYLTDVQAELLLRNHVAIQDVTPLKLREVSDEPPLPVPADAGDAVAAAPRAPEKKLRMTVDGEHFYADITGGRIRMNERMFDSLAHARDAMRREQNKLGVWEYYDETTSSWRAMSRA
jgi:hypothetical protein